MVSSDHTISDNRQRVWSTDGIASASSEGHRQTETEGGEEEEVVLNINLSNINSEVDLPESIKLHSAEPKGTPDVFVGIAF